MTPQVTTRSSGNSVAANGGPTPPSSLGRFFNLDNRYLPPLFITTILIVGQLNFGVLESLSRTLLAIGTAMVCEMVLGRWLYGKFPHLASAYITGISVGILDRSPEYWPYALRSVFVVTLTLATLELIVSAWSPQGRQAPRRPSPAPGSLPHR